MKAQGKYYWNIDRIMWLIIGTVVTVSLFCLIYRLRDALLPFFAACLIAYMLQPLVELNRKWLRLKGRVVASFLALFEVGIVIWAVVWLTLPIITRELDSLSRILADISSGKNQLPPAYTSIAAYIERYVAPGHISGILANANMEQWLGKGMLLLEESASVIMRALSWMLMLIYILFILIDYPEIARGFKQVIPLRFRKEAMVVVNDILVSMNKYFRGQGLVALVAMVLYTVGFLIVGLPLAVPMGMLVGVLYMIPYFQYITIVPVAAICLIYSLGGEITFLPEFGKCILVYVFVQCICDYIVTPHIMGKELGLNPAVILLSLAVWGSLLGIIGMIIALPVTALIMTYYQLYISNRK